MLSNFDDYNKSKENLSNCYNILKDDVQNILQKVSPIEQSRIDFLTSRPWWSKVYTCFQEYMVNLFSGTHVVGGNTDSVVSIYKLDTIHIPTEGSLWPNKSTIISKMEESRCHDNCGELYLFDES